jgi:type VI protein secretion system component VasF
VDKVSALEKICGPALSALCNYWQLVKSGHPLTRDEFRRDIENILDDAKAKAAASFELEREYARIERPLVFFIDYIVKEGTFPFKGEWRELARNYNELSGDEKFFDLLSEALDDGDSGSGNSSCLVLYNMMLGLGFDGARRSDYIEDCMERCAAKIENGGFNVRREPFVTQAVNTGDNAAASSPYRKPAVALAVSVVFALVALAVNVAAFVETSGRYRDTISATIKDAVPKSAGILYTDPVSHDGAPWSHGDYDYPEPAAYPETQPMVTPPVTTQPVVAQPVVAPAAVAPADTQPVVPQPVVAQPAVTHTDTQPIVDVPPHSPEPAAYIDTPDDANGGGNQ